ncbi:MAG: hypothetical protein MJE68_06340 [Proteobacteria bacterium]|nr:hypothetical protein [Pseudomonadota bacterium]
MVNFFYNNIIDEGGSSSVHIAVPIVIPIVIIIILTVVLVLQLVAVWCYKRSNGIIKLAITTISKYSLVNISIIQLQVVLLRKEHQLILHNNNIAIEKKSDAVKNFNLSDFLHVGGGEEGKLCIIAQLRKLRIIVVLPGFFLGGLRGIIVY